MAMPRASSASSARAERRAMSSQTGCPEGASAECGSDRPSASPTTCEVAAVPRNWQPPPGEAQARQTEFRGGFAGSSAVRETRAEGLHRAGVFALFRRQRDAAGDQHAREDRAIRPAPSSWRAGLCRRWQCRARPARAAASGSGAGTRWRRRCDTAGCRTCRWCPACGRRRDRSKSRRKGSAPSGCNSSAAACTSKPISQWPV